MAAGRKRGFDKAEALDKAMRAFWASGYAGTSIRDLTAALGINKPSLYAAFGNKEQLFNAAIEHYMAHYGAPKWSELTEPADAPLETRLRAYLYSIIDLITGTESPPGCLFVKSSCESGSASMPDDITTALQEMGHASEEALIRFLNAEKRRGGLSKDARAKEIADYILSVMYGLSVLAKRKKSKRELRAIVDTALHAVPTAGTH